MEGKGKLHIVLVPFPVEGHLTPMLTLGNILHSRGFSVVVAHGNFNAPDPSNHPDFTFLPLSDNTTPDAKYADLVAFIRRLNENCKPRLHDYLVDTTERAQDKLYHQIACIIHDPFMYFAEDVAKTLKLPNIALYTSNASSVLAYLSIPRLHTQGFLPLKEDSTMDDLVPDLQPIRFKDLPAFINENLVLDLTLQLNAIAFRRPSAVIWNTVDQLEHSTLKQLHEHQNYHRVPFFTIGPLHKVSQKNSTSQLIDDKTCMSWLNQQVPKSVIYVSVGSLAFMNEKEVVEMAWGLANSNQPFLWVVRPGSVHGSEWTELLPDKFKETVGERGCIVKWAPQKEVLAHYAVGGFWSHCGWNSTLESISEGVPMICWPSFSDQMVNGRYLSYVWGVGLEMEHELERGNIERVVRRLMVEDEGSEVGQKAAELKEKVEIAIKKGGSSYNSLNELVDYIFSFEHLKTKCV